MKIGKLLDEYLIEMKGKKFNTNRWLESKDIKIYVRKSIRYLNLKGYTCFDIATVEVREKIRGKGLFSFILNHIEGIVGSNDEYDAIYVENVLNERFQAFLFRQGYDKLEHVNCFYKLKNKGDDNEGNQVS